MELDHEEHQAGFQAGVSFQSFGRLKSGPWSDAPEGFALTRIRQAFYAATMFSGCNPLRLVFKERVRVPWTA